MPTIEQLFADIRKMSPEEIMSDKMRWRFGDTNPVMADVDYVTVIEMGDLIYQNSSPDARRNTDDLKPASAVADRGGRENNQRFFAENFLGVAMQRSRKGDTDAIRVGTTGVFEFDCLANANSWELGDLVGVEQNYSGSANSGRLLNQQVIAVDSPQYAIARIAKRASKEETSVLIDVFSTVMNGGVAGTTAAGRG